MACPGADDGAVRTGEDAVVVVAERQRADGHDLGDGAEAEHIAVVQLAHVEQALRRMAQRVCHQLIQTAQ